MRRQEYDMLKRKIEQEKIYSAQLKMINSPSIQIPEPNTYPEAQQQPSINSNASTHISNFINLNLDSNNESLSMQQNLTYPETKHSDHSYKQNQNQSHFHNQTSCYDNSQSHQNNNFNQYYHQQSVKTDTNPHNVVKSEANEIGQDLLKIMEYNKQQIQKEHHQYEMNSVKMSENSDVDIQQVDRLGVEKFNLDPESSDTHSKSEHNNLLFINQLNKVTQHHNLKELSNLSNSLNNFNNRVHMSHQVQKKTHNNVSNCDQVDISTVSDSDNNSESGHSIDTSPNDEPKLKMEIKISTQPEENFKRDLLEVVNQLDHDQISYNGDNHLNIIANPEDEIKSIKEELKSITSEDNFSKSSKSKYSDSESQIHGNTCSQNHNSTKSSSQPEITQSQYQNPNMTSQYDSSNTSNSNSTLNLNLKPSNPPKDKPKCTMYLADCAARNLEARLEAEKELAKFIPNWNSLLQNDTNVIVNPMWMNDNENGTTTLMSSSTASMHEEEDILSSAVSGKICKSFQHEIKPLRFEMSDVSTKKT